MVKRDWPLMAVNGHSFLDEDAPFMRLRNLRIRYIM